MKELPGRLERLALKGLEVLSGTRRSLFSSSFSRSCFLFLARSRFALLKLVYFYTISTRLVPYGLSLFKAVFYFLTLI